MGPMVGGNGGASLAVQGSPLAAFDWHARALLLQHTA